MSYLRRKAKKVKYELLAEAGCELAQGKDKIPWPILKERLDHDFSELARMSRADDDGIVTCIDGCGETGHWKDFDCGHFADRDNLPTRWLLDNCFPQNRACNRFKTGKRYEFGRALNAMKPGMADELLLKARDPVLAAKVRHEAPEMLDQIRAQLKIQRKRFR